MEARQRLLLTSSLGDSRVYRAHGNTPISPISSQCTVIAVYSNYCMLVWTNDRTLHDWQAVADSGWLLICRRRHGLFVKCTFIHSTHTHTHTRLTALCPGLPGWAGTRKVKPIWILLKQETVSGSGISWAICKSAHRSRQITTPAPHHSVFTGRMPFLPHNQQCQSTEGFMHSTWTFN